MNCSVRPHPARDGHCHCLTARPPAPSVITSRSTVTGRFFNLVVRLLALPGLHHTQCGFKCFRGAVADEIFPLQTMNGSSFDVEVLFIARQTTAVDSWKSPVPWYFSAESECRIVHDLIKVGFEFKLPSGAMPGMGNTKPERLHFFMCKKP